MSEREQNVKQDVSVREGAPEPSDPPAAERAEQEKGTNEAASVLAGADVTPSRIDQSGGADADKEAKRKAAAEARAARAAAKAQANPAGEGGAPAEPKPPSPKQPLLDRLVAILKEEVGEDAVVEAWINPNGEVPTVSLRADRLAACARVLRDHPELKLNYLRNVAGVDMETHMEVVYHLISLEKRENYSVKVKTDRDRPSVPSVTEVWETANWNEREIYDLLGIDFPGHPDLRRIMMPDDWVGHPLRKDYVPIDPEV